MGYPGWQRLFMRRFRFRSSLYGNPLRRSSRRFFRPANDTEASLYTRDSLRSKRFRSSYCTKVRASGWLRDDGIEGSIKTLCNSHNPAMFILYLFTWLFCSVRTLQGRLVQPKVPCVVWCKPNWLPHVRRHRVLHLKTTAFFNAITCLSFWEFFYTCLVINEKSLKPSLYNIKLHFCSQKEGNMLSLLLTWDTRCGCTINWPSREFG